MIRCYCCSKSADFKALPLKHQYERLREFKRHFGLSVRRVSGLTQLLPANAEEAFLDMLRREYCRSPPQRVILLDETGVLWNPAAPTTLEKTGAKKVAVKVAYEKRQSTALLWASCDLRVQGEELIMENFYFGPPVVVFKGTEGVAHKNSVETLVRQATAGKPVTGAVSSSGWMTEPIFLRWLSSLDVKPGAPTWIILDLYAVH